MTANIYTVPAGAPFLDALATAILSGNLPEAGGAAPDVLSLPDITLLLPTRRAARAAQEAFLKASGRSALLMPRIQPIAEGDEDASLLSALNEGRDGGGLDLLPAISPLNRTLVLMQLVERWQKAREASADPLQPISTGTPAQAANLAAELAKLMDDVERENISLDDIGKLVPDNYSEHWQQTVAFLEIVTAYWPRHLEENGLVSPASRRNDLMLAEARRIAELPEHVPVIVAGVTGSIPATVELMKAVAARKRGAIVLPAFDQSLDDESFAKITGHPDHPGHPEHPQFGLKTLIDSLGVGRDAVRTLPGVTIDPDKAARATFISEAMRPSLTTGLWQSYAAHVSRDEVKRGLAGVSLIEAPSAQDEAEAIALILREAVDTKGRTAALVSPDRLLARRVAVRLEAFGIRVDDSAGRPFAKTVPGTFLALVIDAAVSGFAPAETMALLKHPLMRAGLPAFDVRRFGRALEIAAFRTAYLGRGLQGIEAALDNADRDRLAGERMHAAAKRLFDEDLAGARTLVQLLREAFAPLTELYESPAAHALSAFARAHASVCEALAKLPEAEASSGVNPLWQGEAGGVARTFFQSLIAEDTPKVSITAADYGDLYLSLTARENVRERTPVHPRVAIWGPYEARLQQPDVLVLGSLNEGTWPEATDPGAWLNRPMRAELGLPSPEEETGRAAHDFTSLFGADTVYLTRASKVKGVPTVPSRWLMRIGALLRGLDLSDALNADKPWLGWARARDRIDADKRIRIAAPEPRPPVGLRPRKLSVTAIESWISNPYSVYARHILKLDALPELGASPDQSLRGALVHEVLSTFGSKFPGRLPDDIGAELRAIAREVLEAYTGHPRVAAFWLPRLERFLAWFASSEGERRQGMRSVSSEISGTRVLGAPAGAFTLTARADRIDDDGTSLVITDYKTGGAPNNARVQSGRAPQLPLEAAIALGETGFPNLAGRRVAGLRYIRATGGEPPGETFDVKVDDVAALAEAALSGLSSLVQRYDDPSTPYRAVRRPNFKYDYDQYAQLARVAEWSAHVDDENGT